MRTPPLPLIMFKSLQIVNHFKSIDLRKKHHFKLQPLPHRPSIKAKDTLQGQKYKVSRKSCYTNMQGHNRFSTRITIKRLNTPLSHKHLPADKTPALSRTATVKLVKKPCLQTEQSQTKTIRKGQAASEKEEFAHQLALRREENQLSLGEEVGVLKGYQQQRQNFLNYLAYLIYYVNQEEKDCANKTEVKLQTFFKAVQIFDAYLSGQERKIDQAQIFTATQACILMASKLQDIYYIEVSQIEFDETCQEKIFVQEKAMLEALDYRLCHTTELDFLFDYLPLLGLSPPQSQLLFKACLRNLLLLLRDAQVRQYRSNEITQAVLLYTCLQEQGHLDQVEQLILRHGWNQSHLEGCTALLENTLSAPQPKYLDNIDKIIDYI